MTRQADDDVYPGTAVVHIEARWGGRWYAGSGVLVGRNDVLTASHVILEAGRLPDEVRVFASFDPRARDNVWRAPVDYTYFRAFDPDGDGRIAEGDGRSWSQGGTELDVALLSLAEPIGDRQGWFGIDYGFTAGRASVLGHPGRYGDRLMRDDGYVYKDAVDDALVIDGLEVNPGNSGGPIFVDRGAGPYVVGVVSTRIGAAWLGGHGRWLRDALAENDRLIDEDWDSPDDRDAPAWLGAPVATLVGSASADRLRGAWRADVVFGRDGRDSLDGGAGDDILAGGTGVDSLRGGGGRDTLLGGAELDRLHGGPGFDTAVYWNEQDDYAVRRIGGEVRVFFDGGGFERLFSIERLLFSDGALDL
jgi:Ca2+-binding RTX toxin-like protein